MAGKKNVLRICCMSVPLLFAGLVQTGAAETNVNAILQGYADLALASYEQATDDARHLQDAIGKFAAAPGEATLQQAKQAWLNSRESYGQTEIFRLSGGPIDAEEGWVAEAYGAPEGQLNAWPLDENMIDYTSDADGKQTTGNIIDTAGLFTPGGEAGKAVDVTEITQEAISALNENGGDANVASGYHAIEFLLWGQDQDYANFTEDRVAPGAMVAGQRPISDFTTAQHAKRRLAYLQAAAGLLVTDLDRVSSAWKKTTPANCQTDANGCYRAALLGQLTGADAGKNMPPQAALKGILMGMGVFIKSEVANERIAVAVLTPSEEDEHSCFSDNTHRDISTNYQGFKNVLKAALGERSFGDSVSAQVSATTRQQLDKLLGDIDAKIAHIDTLAKTRWHFDYQILPQNNAAEIKDVKNLMRKLGDVMVDVAKDFNINLQGSDVTDPDETKI